MVFTILVATSSPTLYDNVTNRVAITKNTLTVQSVNGPAQTIIQGSPMPGVTDLENGVRCVYMTLTHCWVVFTLENGTGGLGGGVHCENLTNSIVSNCIIISNVAYYGGGVSGGTVNDSLIASNSAWSKPEAFT